MSLCAIAAAQESGPPPPSAGAVGGGRPLGGGLGAAGFFGPPIDGRHDDLPLALRSAGRDRGAARCVCVCARVMVWGR
eukprot:4606909-Prymnesium_polylepis.1